MTETEQRMAAQAMVEADLAVWSGWLDVVVSTISPVFAQAHTVGQVRELVRDTQPRTFSTRRQPHPAQRT